MQSLEARRRCRQRFCQSIFIANDNWTEGGKETDRETESVKMKEQTEQKLMTLKIADGL